MYLHNVNLHIKEGFSVSETPNKNHGKRIGDIVSSALNSGNLSRLGELGPAVSEAAQDIGKSIQQAVSSAQQSTGQPPPPAAPATPPPNQTMRPAWQGSAAPAVKTPGRNLGLAALTFGILGLVTFGLGSIVFGVAALAGSLSMLPLGIGFAGAFLFSGLLTADGVAKRRLVKRVAQYESLFQTKKVLSLEDISAAIGREPKDIKRDVRRAKKHKLLADMYWDAGETCLMQGEQTYKLYLETEQNRKQREAEEEARRQRMEDPQIAAMEHFRSESAEMLRRIRQADESIENTLVSEKIVKLEAVSHKIVECVQTYPEKLPEVRKFMDYYMPTTLKMLEKYQQYEQMDLQPASVREARANIESGLDTLDIAYNNLLDSLYQHDTLDVVTDIEVLQQMLEQEGLTGNRFDISDKSPQLTLEPQDTDTQ